MNVTRKVCSNGCTSADPTSLPSSLGWAIQDDGRLALFAAILDCPTQRLGTKLMLIYKTVIPKGKCLDKEMRVTNSRNHIHSWPTHFNYLLAEQKLDFWGNVWFNSSCYHPPPPPLPRCTPRRKIWPFYPGSGDFQVVLSQG